MIKGTLISLDMTLKEIVIRMEENKMGVMTIGGITPLRILQFMNTV